MYIYLLYHLTKEELYTSFGKKRNNSLYSYTYSTCLSHPFVRIHRFRNLQPHLFLDVHDECILHITVLGCFIPEMQSFFYRVNVLRRRTAPKFTGPEAPRRRASFLLFYFYQTALLRGEQREQNDRELPFGLRWCGRRPLCGSIRAYHSVARLDTLVVPKLTYNYTIYQVRI